MTNLFDCLNDTGYAAQLKEGLCHLAKSFNSYFELTQRLHTCSPTVKKELFQVKECTERRIVGLSETVTGFPDQCHDYPGMAKCLEGMKRDICLGIFKLLAGEEPE